MSFVGCRGKLANGELCECGLSYTIEEMRENLNCENPNCKHCKWSHTEKAVLASQSGNNDLDLRVQVKQLQDIVLSKTLPGFQLTSTSAKVLFTKFECIATTAKLSSCDKIITDLKLPGSVEAAMEWEQFKNLFNSKSDKGKKVNYEVDIMQPVFMEWLKVNCGDSLVIGEVEIVDTHAKPYLNNKKPDISLVIKGHKPTVCSVISMVELQVGNLDHEHKLKCIDYCNEVMNNSPQRTKFKILLTNLVDSITIFTVSRGNLKPYQYHYSELMWDKSTLFNFLHQSQEQFGYSLPLLIIEDTFLEINSCLGKGSTACVYEVTYLNHNSVAKVFNDSEDCTLERDAYENITVINLNNIQLCLPKLLLSTESFILTEPVCDVQADYNNLCPEHIINLIDTLKFCFYNDIVIGDIAPKHIMIYKNKVQLIDLGASYIIDLNNVSFPKNASFGTLPYSPQYVYDIIKNDFKEISREKFKSFDLYCLTKSLLALFKPKLKQSLESASICNLATMKLKCAAYEKIWDCIYINYKTLFDKCGELDFDFICSFFCNEASF